MMTISSSLDRTPDGRPQGPSHHILSPLAPTIRRIVPPSPCIVGAGEDVDVGKGPLWLPVRAHHHISSPYLKCIDHKPSPLLWTNWPEKGLRRHSRGDGLSSPSFGSRFIAFSSLSSRHGHVV